MDAPPWDGELEMRLLTFGLLAALAPVLLTEAALAQDAPPATVKDGFSLAVTGDLIGPEHPITGLGDPGTLRIVKLLSGADVAFGNQEGAIFDLDKFSGYPAAQNGGGTPINDASVAFDLKAMGFKIMSLANNHATDFGVEGLRETRRSLDAAGVVHAGTGDSLTEARAPAYLATPKGKVGLVSIAGTYTDLSVAADANPGRGFAARPGLSPLRSRELQQVTAEQMRTLREIAARSQTPDAAKNPEVFSAAKTGQEMTIGRTTFRVADRAGLSYDVNGDDRAALLASVKEARGKSDLVVFSIHAHETASSDPEDARPADYMTPLFHDLIDAGADAVVRHGPHALMGVEIYKGRPIFYGMGSLMFQVGDKNRQFRGFTLPEAWYDGAVAVSEFQQGRVATVRLYPFVQNLEDARLQGTPKSPSQADAQRILKRIQAASTPFGTHIEIEGEVGVIRVAAGR
jgi:poly-gamma-glutamate capsule biosynthesis protein CapA/YwtB (metallophosphatase superfamily)